MYILTISTIFPGHRYYDLRGSDESSSSILFIIHTATAILHSSTISGTDFWVPTAGPMWMMLSPAPPLLETLSIRAFPVGQPAIDSFRTYPCSPTSSYPT